MFCSELCFTQCRRANFKRNKTCDWCRHIRHTVNYVDFQDGEHQLQFCSDKCLNQYKMNIFCKETEAHLQLHPHLAESTGGKGAGGSGGLITPELWLRDCHSKSPPSELSPSPPPRTPIVEIDRIERKEDVPKEKKKIVRSKKLKNDHREASPRRGEAVTPPKSHSYPPSLLPINGAHINLLPSNMSSEHLPRPPFLNMGFFNHPPMFPPDHPVHRNGPRFPGLLKPQMISPPSPPPVINPTTARLSAPPSLPPVKSLLPPVTVLVPYPIPLPIPIPIPIPIPLLGLFDKMKAKEGTETQSAEVPKEEKQQSEAETEETPSAQSPRPISKSSPPPSKVEKIPEAIAPSTKTPAPSTSVPRPLRKRKRMTELPSEGESGVKRKTVPV